jgi:hypothetical protein
MATTKTTNSIKGKTFIFTGTLTEFTRAEAESMVKENGGSILSGVTDKLNYLVVGDDAGSKLEKAKKIKSIKVLKEKEFLKLVPPSKSSIQKAEKEKESETNKSRTKKSTKLIAKKSPVKKVTAVKKTKDESTLVQKSVKKSNSKNEQHKISFSIHARAIKQEDYSGANFSEWFDSGTDEYSLAKPDDYFKKGKFYEVIWSNNQSIKPNIDLVERVFNAINMWATDFEAFFLPESKITVLDSRDTIVKIFEF